MVAPPPRSNPPPVSRPRPPSVPAPPVISAGPKPVPAAPDEFQLGLYHQRSGDFEKALLHYNAALQRDAMNIEAHNNLGHLYLGRGL